MRSGRLAILAALCRRTRPVCRRGLCDHADYPAHDHPGRRDLPMVAAVAFTQFSRQRLLRYSHASRDAAGAVTGFLGEVLDAVQAVKVADAESRCDPPLFRAQRRAPPEPRCGSARYWSILSLGATANIVRPGAGHRPADGRAGHAEPRTAGAFTVGDFALFVTYLRFMVDFPDHLGRVLCRLSDPRGVDPAYGRTPARSAPEYAGRARAGVHERPVPRGPAYGQRPNSTRCTPCARAD